MEWSTKQPLQLLVCALHLEVNSLFLPRNSSLFQLTPFPKLSRLHSCALLKVILLRWGGREVKLMISILRTVESIGLKFFGGSSLMDGLRLVKVSVMLSQKLACRNRNTHYWEAMEKLQKFSLMLTLLWVYFHGLISGSKLFCVNLT